VNECVAGEVDFDGVPAFVSAGVAEFVSDDWFTQSTTTGRRPRAALAGSR
jgi:hypothetical protein